MLGLQADTAVPGFLHVYWGFKLRPSCLHSLCSYLSLSHLSSVKGSMVFKAMECVFTHIIKTLETVSRLAHTHTPRCSSWGSFLCLPSPAFCWKSLQYEPTRITLRVQATEMSFVLKDFSHAVKFCSNSSVHHYKDFISSLSEIISYWNSNLLKNHYFLKSKAHFCW